MPGHSRPKDGVLSHAYVPGIHVLRATDKGVDGRDKPGHDGGEAGTKKFEPATGRPEGLGD